MTRKEIWDALPDEYRDQAIVCTDFWSAYLAVVPADLPCLSCDDVTQVLHLAQRAEGAFVPDWATTGTTFVVTAPGRPMVARYGPGSAA